MPSTYKPRAQSVSAPCGSPNEHAYYAGIDAACPHCTAQGLNKVPHVLTMTTATVARLQREGVL